MKKQLDKLKNNKLLQSAPVPKKKFIWSILQFPLFNSALNELGWFKSVWKESGIDSEGKPIPWITYPMISFLEKRLTKKMTVFEYGSGNSTAWWASHVKQVTSIEYNKGWFNKVKKNLPENASIELWELGKEYPKAISNRKAKYDIVMIDGRYRNECAKESVSALKTGGVIVWDNSDREKYQKGIKYLRKLGYKSLDFVGMVPSSNKISTTSVFYKNKNIFDI